MTRNYTFSGHFWEHQNHNGVVTLVNRMRMGKQTCEKLKAAFEIRVSSEEHHAATLLQMATNLQTCEESGQLGQVLNTTQEQWTLLANTHLQTVEDLNSAVILPLSNLLTKQKQIRRELQANVTKFYNNRQLQARCVLRARDRYNAECTKANEIMQQSSGKEKNITYKRANAVIKKFQQAYDDSMDDLKMVTEEWNKQWKYTCHEFEQLEEERMSFLQTNIYTFNDFLSRTLDISAQTYEKVAQAVDQMDVDVDLDDFVEKSGGIDTIPDAMDYIKLYVLQEATKSQDNDDDHQDNTSTTESETYTSTSMNNEPNMTMETSYKAPVDTIDTNNDVTSLMVGRMEMYNSDDDDFTDSDYDNDGDNDYGYEHDDHDSQNYIVGNDDYQQNDHYEPDGESTNQHSKYSYDDDFQRNDLNHPDNESSQTTTGEYMETNETTPPLNGLGIEATHDNSQHGAMNNFMEDYSERQMDHAMVQQHKINGMNYLEYFDENSDTNNIAVCEEQNVDYSNIDDDVVRQHSTIVPRQHRNMDAVTNTIAKHEFRQQPSSIDTHHMGTYEKPSAASRYSRQQQQPSPPPLPKHQFNPAPPMDLIEDNRSMISTPASPTTNTVNEELDNMLRQLEQQSINRPGNSTLGPCSLTKKKPTGHVRLSGVRPRAPKIKPGQKLLKELARIDTPTSNKNNDNDSNDQNSPLSSTIVAGSDEWPLQASPSKSMASRKNLFDPFSSLATMSSNSLSIASTTTSAAQAERQKQKQEKWMLEEVTQAMRQNTDIKRRPLPERPLNSTTEQTGRHMHS